ncbi:hypothetical protein [Eubacterium callanderi]|uniref:hypothetical protein n=1 Tax=Eubacterium callanderi TaxID=53442 RepID=UPI003AB4F02E
MDYTKLLLDTIPKNEIMRIFNEPKIELDNEFLGFTNVYGAVLNFVPRHFTIVDLGCYIAAQAYLFKNYEKYIGVDVCELERFKPENAIHYQITIQEYLLKHTNDLCLETTFAICSYIPDKEAVQMAREKFPNILVFYPAGDEHPKLDKNQLEKAI